MMCRVIVCAALTVGLLRSGIPAVAGEAPVVKAVRFEGCTLRPEEELRSQLRLRPGEPFTEAALEASVAAVEAYYHAHGCPFATVTAEYGLQPEGVVRLPIEEGRIERIAITGLRRTREAVVRRELESRVGDVFYTPRIDRERQRLVRLGLFRQITFTPGPGSRVGWVTLTIEVEEARSFSGIGTVGFSSEVGLVGYVDVQENNLNGRGQQLSVLWERGAYVTVDSEDELRVKATRAGYEVDFAMPQVGSWERSLGLSVYSHATHRYFFYTGDVKAGNVRNYEWRQGWGARWSQEVDAQRLWSVEIAHDKIDYDLLPADLAPPRGYSTRPLTLTQATFALQRDTRDDPLYPHQGGLAQVSWQVSEEAFGSDRTFSKLVCDVRHYQPGGPKQVLAWRVLAGGSTGRLPLSELYWIGGGETLRGYTWDEFAGTRAFVANLELRRPAGQGLEWVSFVDGGYAWPAGRRLSPSDLRFGAGVGLRALTPFGPLRLDLAYGREGLISHFGAGQMF
jgi:outer membrane protein insertion porin family